MAKSIDLTGRRFGRLVVLDKVPVTSARCEYKGIYWRCQCDCGNKSTVRGGNLRRGDTKSCGCLRQENGRRVMQEVGRRPKKRAVQPECQESYPPALHP